jgi:outer membrane biosynthesis protein TonB
MTDRRIRLTALLLTLLLAVAMLLTLLLTSISAASVQAVAAMEQEAPTELFFEDIVVGSIAYEPTEQIDNLPSSNEGAEAPGTDLNDASEGVEPIPVVAAAKPSPMKQKPVEQKAGPVKEEKKEPTAEEVAASRLKNSFGAASKAASTTATGSGSGKTTTGDSGSNANASGLGIAGRKLLNRPDLQISNAVGWVKVQIRVGSDGRVVSGSAKVTESSGFGDAATKKRAEDACLNASYQLRYSEDSSQPTQRAVIKWNIK